MNAPHIAIVIHPCASLSREFSSWLDEGKRNRCRSMTSRLQARMSVSHFVFVDYYRPFDIGDRIIIGDTPGSIVPAMSSSWFVEGECGTFGFVVFTSQIAISSQRNVFVSLDISLFSTTLRFAASNEVATVSNGSLASSRITNCARSMNATVHTVLKFHISCHQGRAIENYRDAVDKFVHERPNIWDSVLFFRMEEIDPNNEVVTYRFVCRSRFTWQLVNRVLQSQADLHKFCIALQFKLGINYDAPNTRSVMYFGGSLVDGGIQDYKANVLQNSNINNENEVMTGLVPKDLVPVMRGASQNTLDDDEKALRFAKTVEESRVREQQHRETNDDEMDAPLEEDEHNDLDDDEASSTSQSEAAGDANEAFLNLLQKSHGH